MNRRNATLGTVLSALILMLSLLAAPPANASGDIAKKCAVEGIAIGEDPSICIWAFWDLQTDGTGMKTAYLQVTTENRGALGSPALYNVDVSVTANNSNGFSSLNNQADPHWAREVLVKTPGLKMTLTVSYTVNISPGEDRRRTLTLVYGPNA